MEVVPEAKSSVMEDSQPSSPSAGDNQSVRPSGLNATSRWYSVDGTPSIAEVPEGRPAGRAVAARYHQQRLARMPGGRRCPLEPVIADGVAVDGRIRTDGADLTHLPVPVLPDPDRRSFGVPAGHQRQAGVADQPLHGGSRADLRQNSIGTPYR
jgi:hypothetical protein